MRDISDRAGITEAYLYRYFTSKAELYHAAELVQRLNEIMLEFMVAAAGGPARRGRAGGR